MQNNTITHVEIPAPDLAGAIVFYSAIFNWKIEIVKEESYAFFMIGDTNTGGGLNASLKVAKEETGCQIVVDVEDIEQTLAAVQAAGGKIILAKTDIGGGHGYYAVIQDPNGNQLQIHSRN